MSGFCEPSIQSLSFMKLDVFNSCETVSSSNTFLLGGFKLRRQAGRYVSSYLVFFQWPCSPTRALGRPQFIFLDDTKLETHTHTHTHTHPARLLWTSERFVAEAATYTKHNKHKTRIFMPSPGFERAIPAMKRLQTHPLARTARGIGRYLTVTILLKKMEENKRRVPWWCLVLGDN